MDITDNGLNLIKHFEGFSGTIYLCPAGHPTIGYGHVVLDHEAEAFIDGITEEQASNLLKQDTNIAEQAVERLIPVSLTDGQFDALVSFTFNLGSGALQRSTLRRKLNRKDYAGASREFSRWVWAGGRRLKGLVRRRQAEAELFNKISGAFQTQNPAAA
jgi:GH24 family phage-related lysozyme (muramidase)